MLRRSTTLLWPSDTAGRADPSSPATGSRLVANSASRTEHIMANVIELFAKQSLRTLGLAYRDFGSPAELPASWLQDPDNWVRDQPTVEEVRVLPRVGFPAHTTLSHQ